MEENSMELKGYGYGSGYGYGYGDGDGSGYGDGYGYGYGSGYGSGDGHGYGYDKDLREYFLLIADILDAKWVLAEPDIEIRRMMIEVMGAERFFKQLEAKIVHTDLDCYNNPRSLLRIPLSDTRAGYLQAVKVVCPTTGRVYHLGVPPSVLTCQEAVASTFGIKPDRYHPDRES